MHPLIALFSLIQSTPAPSTLHRIVASLPRDPISLFTLVLTLGLVAVVIVAGRSSNKEGPEDLPGGGSPTA